MAGYIYFRSEEEFHQVIKDIVEATFGMSKAGADLAKIKRDMIDAAVLATEIVEHGKAI